MNARHEGMPASPRQQLLHQLSVAPASTDMSLHGTGRMPSLDEAPHIAIEWVIGDQTLTVFHDNDAQHAHRCVLECRLGRPPAGFEDVIHARALHLNFRMSAQGTASLAIDQNSGELIYMRPCAIPPSEPTPLAELFVATESTRQRIVQFLFAGT